MIIKIDTVQNIDDIVVLAVNQLLTRQAQDQHMIVSQEPVDERVARRVSELSVKVEMLEHSNASMQTKIKTLSLELDQALTERGAYLQQVENLQRRLKTGEEAANAKVNITYTEPHQSKEAMVRDQLGAYIKTTAAPDRGE